MRATTNVSNSESRMSVNQQSNFEVTPPTWYSPGPVFSAGVKAISNQLFQNLRSAGNTV